MSPSSAPPEINRFWRRALWDTELNRLYSHLDKVTHSVDVHQKKLYLENEFHDKARDRATQLYADRIARENIGMFKRLMAVHTRKPREFLTHHVQNPKTHSRFLEYQRVMMDNHRLVDRLLSARSFVNDRGSWDEHALEHEAMLLRLSHNPKNCFIPNLKAKRRRDQRLMREQSIISQARAKIEAKSLGVHQLQQQQLERVSREMEAAGLHMTSNGVSEPYVSREKTPKYTYPLPPSEPDGAPHPTVLLPHGTHLVAPALIDQSQYDALSQSLAGLDLQPYHAHAHGIASSSVAVSASAPSSPHHSHRTRAFATTGELADTLFTIPMPPPATSHGESIAVSSSASKPPKEDAIYYLPNRHDPAQSHHEPVYPFKFPPLETREGTAMRDDSNPSTSPEHRRGRSTMGSAAGAQMYAQAQAQSYEMDETPYEQSYDPSASQTVSHIYPTSSSSISHQVANSPLRHTPSQQFLDYFHQRSGDGSLVPSAPRTHLPPGVARSTRHSHGPTRRRVHHVPHMSSGPAVGGGVFNSGVGRSLVQTPSHHYDVPSAYANLVATSSTLPVGSASSGGRSHRRRTQQNKLEDLLDQFIASNESHHASPPSPPSDASDEKQHSQPMPPSSYTARSSMSEKRASATMQPRPPNTERIGSTTTSKSIGTGRRGETDRDACQYTTAQSIN